MLGNLKALLVVLALSLVVFHVCRPLCLEFMRRETFTRRRNVWLALTVVGFLSPSFWLFAIFAVIALLWATSHDENPLALFMFVSFVVPNVNLDLPVTGIGQLFDLSHYRILSLAILVPLLLRDRRVTTLAQPARWRAEDTLLAAFLLLQLALFVPHETLTNTMRRGFLAILDTFIVFYAFSRLACKEHVGDVMCSFWVACAIMALIAVFESLKGWLLYTGLAAQWGDPNVFSWLFRGNSLRAQAAAGHSINLGYHLAIGLGFYLFLRPFAISRRTDLAIVAVLSAAIVVTYARGPWVTALLIVFAFLVLRPNGLRRLRIPLVVTACAFAVLYLTPLKATILDQLPFVGTASQDTIEYRRLLAEVSWQLIQQNPLFGDPFAHLQMESLRQGQGIIDMVNGYLFTALYTGLVGLALVVAVFLLPLARAFGAYTRIGRGDADLGPMGTALIACSLGSLFYIATAGYGTMMYVLCGLLASYAAIVRRPFPLPHAEPRTGTLRGLTQAAG